MSTAQSEQPKLTSTVGYYNGNKWPIHLVISELGVTLHLKSGEFILDKQGRKINDPFFDKYAKPLQLSKEVSRNGQVPLIVVPPITAATVSQRPPNAVSAAVGFTADRKPIMPVNRPVPSPHAVNTPTHMGMSVEEARRRGLIGGAVREVPEDYGVTDTSGRPVSVDQAPPIRYAIESTPKVRQAEQLPEGLLQVDDKVDPSQQGTRQALVSSMQQAAAATSIVESATGFMNQATLHDAAQPVAPAPAVRPQTVQDIEEPLPQPNIFAPGQVQPAPTAASAVAASVAAGAQKMRPPKTGVIVPKAAPAAAAPAPAAESKEPAPKNAKPFVCALDGKDFRYRSQLATYAQRKFPEKVSEILAPYPETE
jgi:hypothetical protein